MGCEGGGNSDGATNSFATISTVTVAETEAPPTLSGVLSLEEAAELNNEVFLAGVALDAARQWAQESGFKTVLVFSDAESVGLTAEFDPTRLVLVVENGRVIVASAG